MKRALGFWLGCWLCLCGLAGYASGSTPALQLSYLQDDTGRLTPAQVQTASRWTPLAGTTVNFGYTGQTVWLRARLGPADSGQRWLLGVQYAQIDELDTYQRDTHGTLHHASSGDSRPFALRPVAHRLFYFPLTLSASQPTDLYLRARSAGTLLLPVVLTTAEQLQANDRVQQLLAGVFAGTLLAMLAYNLLLFLSLREASYLYYVLYIGCFALAQAILYGLASEYLWPAAALNNSALPLVTALTALFLALFSRAFLNVGQWRPARLALDGLVWLFALIALAAVWLDYSLTMPAAIAASMLAPIVVSLIATRLWWHGYQPARYYLLAFAALLAGFLANGLSSFNLVAGGFWADYGMPIGSMLEITLLSFALAHRLKLAQEANQRLQQAHAAELEQRVDERTRQLAEVLDELTLHDALTGLKNRKFFDEQLQQWWRHAQRWQSPLALLMIDIDHFKAVNDRYGHPAGDAALQQVARLLADSLQRPGDEAVRYGGEEFAVLLPSTDAEGAAQLAERLRATVAGQAFDLAGHRLPLTVSIGVAHIDSGDPLPPAGLIARADQALYLAKRNGRNRVEYSLTAPPNC